MGRKIAIPFSEKQQPNTGKYSNAVLCDGWLFVSGHGPLDMKTVKIIPGTIEEQTRLTLENLRVVLNNAGCELDDVVKTTVHLSDINDWAAFNKTYGEFFSGVLPARTTVQSGLPETMKIEIDVIARVPETRKKLPHRPEARKERSRSAKRR